MQRFSGASASAASRLYGASSRVVMRAVLQKIQSLQVSSTCSSVSAVPSRSFSSKSVDPKLMAETMEAANRGDVAKLQQLITAGADINKGDFDRRRPVHVAASEGHVEVVSFLISNGADVNVEDRWGNTPMDDAIVCKQDAVLPVLRQAGGKIGRNRTSDVTTMMCQAAAEGNVTLLQRMVDAGVDLSMGDYDARTPLHVAASEGHLATVDFLIKNGAKINVIDRFGNTPLSEATRSRSKHRKPVVQLLQQVGGFMDSSDYDIRRDGLLVGSVGRSLHFMSQRLGCSHLEFWMASEDESEFTTNDGLQYTTKDVATKLSSFLSANNDNSYANSTHNLIGKVWSSKQTMIVSDITEKYLPNSYQQAKSCGIKSCLVIPVVFQERCIGILKSYHLDVPQFTEAQLESFSKFAGSLIASGVVRRGKVLTHDDTHGVFSSKFAEVYNLIVAEEVFSPNLVYNEVDWFFSMGIQKHYFNRFTEREIANHVHSFIAAKKLAATTGKPEDIMLNIENKAEGDNTSVLCMCPHDHVKMVEAEQLLQNHLSKAPKDKPYTMEFFTSNNPIVPGGKEKLCLYVLETSDWNNASKLGQVNETQLSEISSKLFMKTKSPEIHQRYQEVIQHTLQKISPLAQVFPVYRDGTIPIMFSFLQGAGTTTPYMLQLTELLNHNGMVAHRKFVETFANGVVVFSLYVEQGSADKINMLLKQFSMLHLVPETTLTRGFLAGKYSPEEYTYVSAAGRFSYYFINRKTEEFEALAGSLKNDPLNMGRLRLLQTRLKREAVSLERISSCVQQYHSLIRELFADFHRNVTMPRDNEGRFILNPGILAKIKAESMNVMDQQILQTFLVFNTHMLKTNFYKTQKAALSFRLDPSFLKDSDLPQVPFGLFFVMGSDFQGFHLRFRDISRGGIRVIRSNSPQQYNSNLETLFAENYGLAYTQNKKNKDIPEFGSKGTILLNVGQSQPFLAFQKYTSGLLDLIVANEEVVDNYGKPEILFLGPDEGTADYMEWAARYASKRGYPFWRAFTTGKPPSLGGIPHDTFGMTTRSVHRYVLNCLDKMGLKEEDVTKLQTGGPDGDLGSNEILLSKDRTLAVVDGSGVLYDPNGIDRTELTRLAHARSMIKGFDTSKLSKGGFKVLTSDTNIMLPNGEFVSSGLAFRNEFHLHPLSSTDLFVPCGGRPEAVNLSNVHRLFDDKGKPRFKIIIEGANLFFTQDARMVLENAGVILYKDASANKGGVTSSSLEVLAALTLDAEQFDQHMALKDPKNPPQFYSEYVKEIQQRIENDAALEFECIWKENAKTKTHRYILTDAVSDKINSLNDHIQSSSLWANHSVRHVVLSAALPKKLQELVDIETIMTRVPDSYLKAIFGAYLASRYVYKFGLDANEFAFFEFMQPYLKEASSIPLPGLQQN